MPWVEGHVIGGTLIYPGAGMVVMAIEAADQMVNDADAISGFELKAVKFQRALVIPRTAEGVETSLLLRTVNGGERPTLWVEFRLCSWQNDAWEEHCHGYIRVDYQSASNDTEQTRVCEDWSQRHDQLEHTCTAKLVDDDIYTSLQGSGFQFGPAFQTVTGAKCNGREAIALVKVFQWPERNIRRITSSILPLWMASYTCPQWLLWELRISKSLPLFRLGSDRSGWLARVLMGLLTEFRRRHG
jgi:acyl transferase domain-containing protein